MTQEGGCSVGLGIDDEGVLKKLLEHMNSHVPAKRRLLSELIEMAEPCYLDRTGREMTISREELLIIQRMLPQLNLRDIKLPIVLFADASMPYPTWKVEGEDECELLSKLLGRARVPGSGPMYLYPVHLAELRRKLPTTTTCVFVP